MKKEALLQADIAGDSSAHWRTSVLVRDNAHDGETTTCSRNIFLPLLLDLLTTAKWKSLLSLLVNETREKYSLFSCNQNKDRESLHSLKLKPPLAILQALPSSACPTQDALGAVF
jgi:hypothetical protein